MSDTSLLIAAFIVGFATGLRTFTPMAFICWVAVWGWLPLGGSRLAFLGTETGAVIVTILAVIELIGDKLPITPRRTSKGPLGGRVIIASFAGASLALGMGRPWIFPMLCGVVAAVAGAFAGFNYRTRLTKKTPIPDFVFALIEDVATIALTLCAFKMLFG